MLARMRVAWLIVVPLVAVAGCAVPVAGRPVGTPPAPVTAVKPGKTGLSVITDLETRHRVTFPVNDACRGAAYDDATCGAQLQGFRDVAADVLDMAGTREDPASRKATGAAKSLAESFLALTGIGCFGFRATSGVDSATRRELCPSELQLVELSYLDMQAAVVSGSF